MFVGIKITHDYNFSKQQLYFMYIPIYKIETKFLGNNKNTKFYLFSLIILFRKKFKDSNKGTFYFINIPFGKIKIQENCKVINLLGFTIYKYKSNNYIENNFSYKDKNILDKIEQKLLDKVEQKLLDKIEQKLLDKIEQKLLDKIEQKLLDKIEQKLLDKVEQKLLDKIEQKYMEMDILIKTISSALREIKRSEDKK